MKSVLNFQNASYFCTHRKLPPVFMRAKIHTYPICILTVPKRTISVNVFLEKILTKWVDSWWTILIFCLNCFWTPAIKDPALCRTPKTPWYLSYHAWQVLAQLHPGKRSDLDKRMAITCYWVSANKIWLAGNTMVITCNESCHWYIMLNLITLLLEATSREWLYK